jgi:hypothetical protein
MTPVGFEPTISANERPQTHALDRADTVIDNSPVQARLIDNYYLQIDVKFIR